MSLPQQRSRDSWDLDGIRKAALERLTNSQLTSYKSAKEKPRTSDRSEDSVSKLVPEAELKQFTLVDEMMKNQWLLRLINRRDLVMSIVSTVLLMASIALFATAQIIQPDQFNRNIPKKFYTKAYMWQYNWQQRFLQAYAVSLLSYLIAFHLSVRWRLEMDEQIEQSRVAESELVRFSN
ncbi:hypothetical protein BOX15_Mlig022105g2 [Macrostomum lignano]|uniref:Uncharacterized protein n=1 Tax=Macrostomum lignano TaxID=282301 RepID=A0A267F143_9PLAT|nr:hypothetical protein BOX15_Mlig022105g1 [Macrostomum lignano]PAA75746.1 hypothetical protein BOX15_Mlig022105g3 [Macrostomum lignano]PAA79621.1 hypothetical protein BOX15_Mlig022105g2 [Macrostomum lignano]